MTDPRNDPHLSEIVTRLHDGSSAMVGWISGIGIVVLIAIVLAAGWSSNGNIANIATTSPGATTGSAPMLNQMMPPNTTGAGPTAYPKTPAKAAAPAMQKPGTQ